MHAKQESRNKFSFSIEEIGSNPRWMDSAEGKKKNQLERIKKGQSAMKYVTPPRDKKIDFICVSGA